MTKIDTKALLRTRFAELRAERDAIEKANAPLRERLKAIRVEAAEAEGLIAAKIKLNGAGLSEIDVEMASISRGLMGKTGAEA